MVLNGYVVLKIQKDALYYADWTNTKRRYIFSDIDEQKITDLRRVFSGKTVILIPNMERSMPMLLNLLGKPLNTTRCKDVKQKGTAMNILTRYIESNGKRKSYYNYQRDHWLGILSVINIHLLINDFVKEEQLVKIISSELKKLNRNFSAYTLFSIFLDLKMLVRCESSYKDSIISIPDRRIDLTLG